MYITQVFFPLTLQSLCHVQFKSSLSSLLFKYHSKSFNQFPHQLNLTIQSSIHAFLTVILIHTFLKFNFSAHIHLLYDLSLCPCLYSEGNFHCAPVSTQKAIPLMPLSLLRRQFPLCPCLYSEGNFPYAPVSTQKAISTKIIVDWPIDNYHRAMVHINFIVMQRSQYPCFNLIHHI